MKFLIPLKIPIWKIICPKTMRRKHQIYDSTGAENITDFSMEGDKFSFEAEISGNVIKVFSDNFQKKPIWNYLKERNVQFYLIQTEKYHPKLHYVDFLDDTDTDWLYNFWLYNHHSLFIHWYSLYKRNP